MCMSIGIPTVDFQRVYIEELVSEITMCRIVCGAGRSAESLLSAVPPTRA